MNYTDYLRLKKPEFTDPANIIDINENMDAIDSDSRSVHQLITGLQNDAVTQTEYQQFIRDLAAEMVKYSHTDMSGVTDVKGALDSLLANKVNVGSFEHYALPLNSNFTAPLDCYFSKNQNNEVKVVCYCRRSTYFPTGGFVNDPVFTLPEGYRPPKAIEAPAMLSGVGGYSANIIRITADGLASVLYNWSTNSEYLISHVTFDT